MRNGTSWEDGCSFSFSECFKFLWNIQEIPTPKNIES